MKKILVLLVSIFTLVGVQAQDKVITVDNQTPGWLSSKLTYAEQVAVENLTVTGYMNKTDMDFINGLIKNRSLNVLDLQDVTLLGTDDKENEIWDKFLNFESNDNNKELQKIVMPKGVETWKRSSSKAPIIYYSNVDTLITNWAFTKMCTENYFPRHLIISEGTTKIPKEAFYFSSSQYSNNYRKCDVTLPQSIEELGYDAFYSYSDSIVFCFPEPFVLPKSLIHCGHGNGDGSIPYEWWGNSSTKIIEMPISSERFDFPENMICYGGQDNHHHSFTSDTITVGAECDTLSAELNAKVAIFYTKTPPVTQIGNTHYGKYVFDVLYVPEGCSAAYDKQYSVTITKNKYIKEIREMKQITDISISPKEVELYVGEIQATTATILPDDAFDKTLKWSSSDESVATVDENGTITAVKVGTADITATSADGNVTGSCTVTVKQHAESISLDKTEAEMLKGEKLTLTATVMPEGATNKNVVWTSSDENVASVTNGVVSAKKTGTVTITATTEDGGYTAKCEITVKQHVTKVSLNLHELTLNAGEEKELRAEVTPTDATNKTLVWSSSDETVATVDANGKVSALIAGVAKIYATAEDNSEANDYCEVTVNQPVTGVALDKSEIKLVKIGATEQLTATVQPDDASNKEIKWSSTNTSVCVVSNNGVVTAVGEGTSVVLVTTTDGGYMASCVVTVELPSSINGVYRDGFAVNGNTLTFSNDMATTPVSIYTQGGDAVYKGYANKNITLKPGVYIIQIDGKVIKVSIK